MEKGFGMKRGEEKKKGGGGGDQSNYLTHLFKKKWHISLNVGRSYVKIKGEQPP